MTLPVIRVWNLFSKIEADQSLIFKLDRETALELPGAFYARRNRPGWDGMWHPINVQKGTFPTGLLERIHKLVPIAQVVDERVRPPTIPFNPDILQGVSLSPAHQTEAVNTILEKGRGIVGLSVGSGKTEVGIGAACHVSGLCVWLTHRKELFHQTAERIQWRTGEKPVMIGDGMWGEIKDRTKFVVAMPQTALHEIDLFTQQVKNATFLVCDEVHRSAAAAEWFKVAQKIPAYFRIGLTGTPELGDPVREGRLEATTGPMLIRRRSSDMAAIGWVVPCQVIYHRVDNMPLHGVDYMDARRILIEENPERNAMVVDLAIRAAKEGNRCLVICDTIRHARLIAEILRGEQVRSRMVTGKNDSVMRSQAKKDLKTGALEIMISTPIWDEGVDLPELQTVIVAAGGKSAARFIQRCGRALRKSPGKDKATIHDFFDFGSPYTIRHSASRIRACQKEGFEVIGAPNLKIVAGAQ